MSWILPFWLGGAMATIGYLWCEWKHGAADNYRWMIKYNPVRAWIAISVCVALWPATLHLCASTKAERDD